MIIKKNAAHIHTLSNFVQIITKQSKSKSATAVHEV